MPISSCRPWPDAVAALRKLKAAGVRIITISNFSGKMLRANAEHAGISDLFDDVLSTEVNGTYKPDPRAYALGLKRLKLKKNEIVFAAFGGWGRLWRQDLRLHHSLGEPL
jgi:2-haloacid dehalogenase